MSAIQSYIADQSSRLNLRFSTRLTVDEQLTRIFKAAFPKYSAADIERQVGVLKAHMESLDSKPQKQQPQPQKQKQKQAKTAMPATDAIAIFATEFYDQRDDYISPENWAMAATHMWSVRWPAVPMQTAYFNSYVATRDAAWALCEMSKGLRQQADNKNRRRLWADYSAWFDAIYAEVEDKVGKDMWSPAKISEEATKCWAFDAKRRLLKASNMSADECSAAVDDWLEAGPGV